MNKTQDVLEYNFKDEYQAIGKSQVDYSEKRLHKNIKIISLGFRAVSKNTIFSPQKMGEYVSWQIKKK